jgi:catechol 2,3-dioxygenase-like lactoylglutathione lyase family enzyme
MATEDIDATHAELRSRGVDVDVDEAVARVGAPTRIRLRAAELAEPTPAMFYVRDPDGNSLLIVG